MKVKLLITTADSGYNKLISDNISKHHADAIEVSVISTLECLIETLQKQKYDVALMDASLIDKVDLSSIHLPLVLWSGYENAETVLHYERIKKHQRISSIIATVLERYSKVSKLRSGLDSKEAKITAVWSPAGGVGKTTVALAYAAANVYKDKDVFYLNLEAFSGTPGYLCDNGKSISTVFEMLDTDDGNIKMLIQGICSRENGITYLCGPSNFDDMYVLSTENIKELISACAQLSDELVIDLSCACDFRTRQVFELADKILLVTDSTHSSTSKLNQFKTQNNVFESNREKIELIANKCSAAHESGIDSTKSIPLITSNNATEIYMTLSENYFQ